jgi:hypothetical protein
VSSILDSDVKKELRSVTGVASGNPGAERSTKILKIFVAWWRLGL